MTLRNSTLITVLAAGLLSSLALSLHPNSALAQEPPEAGFGERIEVGVVTVDTWVTDADGRPVSGLTAEAFEVLHDGRPVPISHFTEVRPGPPGARSDAGVPVGDAARATSVDDSTVAHVVVYFDQARLHPTRYPALVQSLREFFAEEVIASERVLILRQSGGLSVEAAFGSTRKELQQALDRLAKGTASGLDMETETRLALEAIRDGWRESEDLVGSASSGLAAVPSASGQPPGAGGAGSGGGGPRAVVGGVGGAAGPDACGMFVNQIQPILDSWTRSNSYRVATTLSHLSSAAGFLAGLPGVKTLIYLSDGLETQPGADLATYASSFCPGAGTDLMTGTLASEMTSSFRDLTRHANSNRVTIYSLQTSGLSSAANADASGGRSERGGGGARARAAFEASHRAGDRAGLGMIAGDTGGRAIINQNDLGPELVRIGREIQHYYSLAYELPPADKNPNRRQHDIEVRLKDKSMKARYRRGFLEKDPSRWLTERIEGALNLGLTSNPLGVRLGAGDIVESDSGSYRIPLHVMVPAENLAFLPRQESFEAEVVMRILSRRIDGNELVTQDKTFRVQGAPGATGLADLVMDLELEAGTHVTAIGVQDGNTGEAAFVSTTLQVGPGG